MDAYEVGRQRWHDRESSRKGDRDKARAGPSEGLRALLDNMEMAPMNIGSSGNQVIATALGEWVVSWATTRLRGNLVLVRARRRFGEALGGVGDHDSLLGDGSSGTKTPSKKKYSTGKLYVEG